MWQIWPVAIFSASLLNSFTSYTLTYFYTQLKIMDLSNMIEKTNYIPRDLIVGVRFCMYVYSVSRTIIS